MTKNQSQPVRVDQPSADPFGDIFDTPSAAPPLTSSLTFQPLQVEAKIDDDDGFGDFDSVTNTNHDAAPQTNVADILGSLTSITPSFVTQPSLEEQKKSPQSGESGDDWGDFDKYEDPNDVQFPTLSPSPTLVSNPSTDQQQESVSAFPEATSVPQDFPRVTNLDDLMSLMNASSTPAVSSLPQTSQISNPSSELKTQNSTPLPLDLFDISKAVPTLENDDDDDFEDFQTFDHSEKPKTQLNALIDISSEPTPNKVAKKSVLPNLLDLNLQPEDTQNQIETNRSWVDAPEKHEPTLDDDWATGNDWGKDDGTGNDWGQDDGVANDWGKDDGTGNDWGQDDGAGNDWGQDDEAGSDGFGDFDECNDAQGSQKDDFDEWNKADQPQKKEETIEIVQKEDQLLFGETKQDEELDTEKSEVKQEQQPVVQKPFDANTLLAGFMADVGAGSLKLSKNEAELEIKSDDFNQIESTVQASDTAKQDKEARIMTLQLIKQKLSPAKSLNLSTNNQIKTVLADKSQMGLLLEHLRLVNELDESSLESIRAHYNLADEIAKTEELKKQAAMEEDYENAAIYKKKIISLQAQAIEPEKLQTDFLDRKPTLRVQTMFEMLCEIDPSFAKNLILQQTQPVSLTPQLKNKVLNKLLVLQEMTRGDKEMKRLKVTLEDTLQVIHGRVRVTEDAQKTLALDLDDLEEEEIQQFKEQKKVQVFMLGVQALKIALSLLKETLEVAENLESQFQMDFEALLNEARQLLQKLNTLDDLLKKQLAMEEDIDQPFQLLDLEQGGLIDTSEEDSGTINIVQLLKAARNQASGDVHCQLCCQRLALGSDILKRLPSLRSVVANGNNYHALCVNLWLQRTQTKELSLSI